MRKLIAAFNMSLDGFCDHTEMIADDEILQHYNDLLSSAGTILYGRITYQLMESYWPTLVKDPSGNKTADEFAVLLDNLFKVVFSHTLKDDDPTITGWKNSRLTKKDLKEEVEELRESRNGGSKYILAGSRSLIVALLNLNLIDEFQICVQPTILGKGLPLLENIVDRIDLKLRKTKIFRSGVITHYYEPVKK